MSWSGKWRKEIVFFFNSFFPLFLREEDNEDDENSDSDSDFGDSVVYYRVKIRLDLSAMQNVGHYYAKRKQNIVKRDRTEAASNK